jgi:hypothetical protein
MWPALSSKLDSPGLEVNTDVPVYSSLVIRQQDKIITTNGGSQKIHRKRGEVKIFGNYGQMETIIVGANLQAWPSTHRFRNGKKMPYLNTLDQAHYRLQLVSRVDIRRPHSNRPLSLPFPSPHRHSLAERQACRSVPVPIHPRRN